MGSGRCRKVKKIKMLTSTGGNLGKKRYYLKMSNIIKMIFSKPGKNENKKTDNEMIRRVIW